MAGDRTRVQTEARQRARHAKATLDAARADHDRQVEDAAALFHQTQLEYEQLRDQLDAARQARDEHVMTLLALETKAARVATLTGLERKHINAIKRAHTSRPQSSRSPNDRNNQRSAS